jgi:hypothetical protein
MHSESQNGTPTATPPEHMVVDTRIPDLQTHYRFLDTFKHSASSRHYIVQDLDLNPEVVNPYFFLKQNFYKDESEYRNALTYYKKYQNYCRGQFAKSDIIKLHKIFFAEDAATHYFELVLVTDIGEPDRIDIEHIKPEQIIKFLKTVCTLLEDIKRQESLYHGNVCLKNIVLMSEELKLSGFKPVYLGKTAVADWKTDICKKLSHYRADMYMVGLLWLRFLGVKTEAMTAKAKTLDQLNGLVEAALKELPPSKRVSIIETLLDTKKHPKLTVEDVIRDFGEWDLLDHLNKNTGQRSEHGGGMLNVFDLDNASQSDRNSLALRTNSRADGTDNPFLQGINQSEEDRITIEGQGHSPNAKQNDYLKIDGQEFTLQDEDSIMGHGQPRPNESQTALTEVAGKKSSEVIQPNFLEGIGGSLVNSEKRLSNVQDKNEEDTVNSLRDFKGGSDGHAIKAQGHFKKDPKARGSGKAGDKDSDTYVDVKIEGNSPTGKSAKRSDKSRPSAKAPAKPRESNITAKKVNTPSVSEQQSSKTPSKKDLTYDSKREVFVARQSQYTTSSYANSNSNATPNPNQSTREASGERPEWVNTSYPAKKVELSEKQIGEIEAGVAQSFKEQKEMLKRGSVEAIKTIHEKQQAAALEAEKLKEKIQEISEKKLAQKKAKGAHDTQPVAEPRHSEAAPKPSSTQPLPPAKKMEKATSGNAKSPTEAPSPTPKPAPVQSTLPISQKSTNAKYNPINDPKKAFGLSTAKDRDHLFSYTHDMQNKNISFKKMLHKVEAQPKTPGEPETKVTRQVSTEPPKQSQTANLSELIGDKTMKGTTQIIPKAHPREFGDIRRQIEAPTFFDSVDLMTRAEEPDQAPAAVAEADPANESSGVLEEKFLNPEQLTEVEQAVAAHLADNKLPLAIEAFKAGYPEVEPLPQILLQVYTRFYAHFKQKRDNKSRAIVMYEILELLSLNPDLDPARTLQQDLTLELARLEAAANKPDAALRLLQSRAFEDAIADPEAYYSLLGNTFVALHDDKLAARSFEKLLNETVAESFIHFDITRLFTLIFRVFQLLYRAKEPIQFAKFFLKMLATLQDIRRVNRVLKLKDNDYQNLIETYILNTLRFAKETGDLNLTNFVLHEAVSRKLLDQEHNMNEDERVELTGYLIGFSGHLSRLPNYGGYQEDFLAYLDYARQVLKCCDLTPTNLKRDLSVNFSLAMHWLRVGDYYKAQGIIEKTINNYYTFFQRPDKGMLEVLFDLGENLVRRNKHQEAIYYFDKILSLNCEDPELRNQTLKEVAKAQFRVGGFVQCKDHIDKFLDHHFERRESGTYWKYLTLRFIAAVKVDVKQFDGVFAELAERQAQPGGKAFGFYLRAFKALTRIFDTHHEFKENHRHLAPIEDIAKGDKKAEDNSARIGPVIAELYYKFLDPKPEVKGRDAYTLFVRQFSDPYLTVSENARLMLNFLLNVTCALINLIPMFKERTHNHEYRQKLFERFKKAISKDVARHIFNEDLKRSNFEAVAVKAAAQRLVESKPLDKTASCDALVNVTKDPGACMCRAAYNGSAELQNLSKDFLKKIKESLFKDEFDDILTYYARFEKTLKEAGIAFEKFDFVKNLIAFHVVNVKKGGIEKPRFHQLLNQLFDYNMLCWHDLKLVVLVLESFKDSRYIEYLAEYLDGTHSNYAQLVFNDLFLNSFNRKFQRLIDQLYQGLQAHRLAPVEEHFFVRHLQFDELGRQSIDVDFKPFDRLRYSVLNDERLLPLFNKNVNFDELVKFYLRFHLYTALRDAVERKSTDQNEMLRKFKNGLLSLLIKLKIDESHVVDLVYQVLLLARLIRFDAPDEMSDSFLKIVQFLVDRYNFAMNYQYSRVMAELGKVFFRYGNFRCALKAMMSAGNLMADTQAVHPYEPAYVVAADRETHQIMIQMYIVASFIEQKRVENANIFLQRLELLKTDNEVLKLDRKVLVVMRELGFKRTAQAMRLVFAAMSDLPSLELSDVQRKLYVAILDKLSYLIVQQTEENEQERKKSESKSRNSTLELYK